MIEQYNKYFVKGATDKCTAAKMFFEKLQMLGLLSTSEQHSIVKGACKNLLTAHLGFNNFYTEPPFAQRLLEITTSLKTPETVQQEYVYTVLMGYVGNPYGVSNAAIEYYEEIIKNFSPKEIDYLINLLDARSLFSEKIKLYPSCRNRYLEALKLIDRDNELGDLIKPRTLSDNFKRIIKENKIRNLRLYDCRHTAASLMLKNGINMK